MSSSYFNIGSINGKHDVKNIKRGLDKIQGVTSVSIGATSSIVAVDYNDEKTSCHKIQKCLETLGYEVKS